MYKWDERFLRLAREVSTWSKDPSTQVGCVIAADKTHIVAGIGYNGFPRKLADDEKLLDRDEKYKYILHAEENALINMHHNQYVKTLYTWPIAPCNRCAAHILQYPQIGRIVAPSTKHERFQEGIEIALEMFKSAGIPVDLIGREE